MIERIKTALILLVVFLFCLFATKNPTPMIILLTIGVVVASFEWANLLPNVQNRYFFIISVLLVNAFCFLKADLAPIFWVFSLVIWFVSLYWVKTYPLKTTGWFNYILLFYVGLVLITAAMSSMYYLWSLSPWWLLYPMILVWSADTGAYFVGRKFGRHKLAPNVSPKKTYQGLFGGLVLSFVIIVITALYVAKLDNISVFAFVALSMVAAAFSVQGDLLESMIKRKVGVKDSGTILPGHGGLLDRIDSLMATLPIFAFGLMVLN